MTGRTRLYILFAQIFVFQAGFGLVVPLIPLYTQKFGVNEIGVGFVIAVYGLARVLADLPAARLAAIMGHTRAMGVGALILTVGSGLTAFAGSLTELLIYRFIAGVGAAITLVVGQSMAASNPGPYSRAKAISYYQAAFLAGVGIGPMLAGPLVELAGDKAPFLVYAALAAVVGLVGLGIKEPVSALAKGEQKHPSILKSLSLLRDLPFLLVCLITLMMFFTRTGGMQGLVPILGTDDLGLTATLVGIAVGINGVANLVVTIVTGALMERFDRRMLLIPGSALLVISMFAFALGQDAVLFFAAAALWGIGTGLAGPITALYVTERAGDDVTGALAVYRMISDVGYLAGPILMGFSAVHLGIPVTFIWSALLLAVFVVAFRIEYGLADRKARNAPPSTHLTQSDSDAELEIEMEMANIDMEIAAQLAFDDEGGSAHIRGALNYEAMGPPGAPKMIFVHPNPMDSSTWLYQMTHFSTWYRCIAVDLPGYGRSPVAVSGVTMAEVADAIWAAVDADGGDSTTKVVLVGCSIGSHIVEYMYHSRPESVGAIVLSGTGWHGAKREFAVRRAIEYRERGVGYRYEHALEDFSPAFRATPIAHWYASLIAERNSGADAESIAAMFDARVDQDPDWLYSELQAPVLILSGSLDTSHAAAFLLDDRLPDSRVEVLEGAGHACYFERPEEFDLRMLAFLTEVAERSPELSPKATAHSQEGS